MNHSLSKVYINQGLALTRTGSFVVASSQEPVHGEERLGLDLMILAVSSNLNDSTVLSFNDLFSVGTGVTLKTWALWWHWGWHKPQHRQL